MSEVLASLKKIGGSGEQYTETVLWTNPDPTSNFTGQNVTLSDSLSNYKYIGIRFAYGTSYKTGEYISTLLETVADFRKFGYGTGVRRNGLAICISDEKNKSYERLCIYVSDTSVHFDPCNQVASSTQANGNAVPLEILGINELAHGKIAPNETIFLGNFASTSMSLTTFTLLDDLSNYRYLIMANSQKDANGNMISDRSAVDAILSIEQLKNDGSITYHSALSNGSAFNVTIGYVDDTHITEQRTGSTNKGFWIYAV